MNASATRRPWAPLMFLLVALTLLFAARPAAAVDPLWDHYKVYDVFGGVIGVSWSDGGPLVLEDQFITWPHDPAAVLQHFANPVVKEHALGVYPVNDSTLHYAWWAISPHPWAAQVIVVNQFGDQTLDVFQPRWLWNPALKNQAGSPPLRNHYKCYDCAGPPINQSITMTDQFGQWSAVVTFPRYFCNPVRKTAGGAPHEIVDPLQHYVCYEFQSPDPTPHTATFTDQWATQRPVELHPSRMICVPTDKTGVTTNTAGTWGRIKVLYR